MDTSLHGHQMRLFDPDNSGNVVHLTDPQPPRLVHYLGSKLRLLPAIISTVESIAPKRGRVCDLFAGSGSVSVALARHWQVIAADIQEYSRVLCAGLLNPPTDSSMAEEILGRASKSRLRAQLYDALTPLLEYEQASLDSAEKGNVDELCDLVAWGSLVAAQDESSGRPGLELCIDEAKERLLKTGLATGVRTVVTRHFGGVYFSWAQAIELDCLLEEVHGLQQSLRDHYLAAVLSVASEIVNTVGKQFAQPIKLRDGSGQPKRHLIRQTLRDRSMRVPHLFLQSLARLRQVGVTGSHRALRGDFADILSDHSVEFDLVYADPPYTRDHYSRFYHVLETMALRDEPDVSTTMIRSNGRARTSRGLYRLDRHQSPFCIVSKAADAFDTLCRSTSLRGVPLVLSYSPFWAGSGNRPRVIAVDEILRICDMHFRAVECRSVQGVSHNKLNLAARNTKVEHDAEVLITCLP